MNHFTLAGPQLQRVPPAGLEVQSRAAPPKFGRFTREKKRRRLRRCSRRSEPVIGIRLLAVIRFSGRSSLFALQRRIACLSSKYETNQLAQLDDFTKLKFKLIKVKLLDSTWNANVTPETAISQHFTSVPSCYWHSIYIPAEDVLSRSSSPGTSVGNISTAAGTRPFCMQEFPHFSRRVVQMTPLGSPPQPTPFFSDSHVTSLPTSPAPSGSHLTSVAFFSPPLLLIYLSWQLFPPSEQTKQTPVSPPTPTPPPTPRA